MRRLMAVLHAVPGERGAMMVEYAILIGFIGVMLVAALTVFRIALDSLFRAAAAIF